MPALLLIFLVVVFSDQSLACSMDMDWVREHDFNLAGLQPDCSTYETRNYRFMKGFLLTSPVVLACSFLGLVSFRLVSAFIHKKKQKRSFRALVRLSLTQLFDLVSAASLITICFLALVFGYHMNGPAMTYSALFTLLVLPVLRVMLALTLDGLNKGHDG